MRTFREEPFIAMLDVAHLAMDRHLATHDARAERLGDRLMPEADAEERDRRIALDIETNEIDAAPGACRRPRPGRNDERTRLLRDQLRGIELVIAKDAQPLAGETLDLLDQVVGEGVVIIDDRDQCRVPRCEW